MIKGLFKLAIVLLIAHALFRFVPPYWSFTQFKWELKETAVGWREHPDGAVADEVLAIARKHNVPITQDNIRVRRQPDHIFVDVSYTVDMELVPTMKRPWTFDANIDAWTLAPPPGVVKKP